MTSPVFLAAAPLLADAREGSLVRLSGPEGRHAATVRRLRPGESVDLVDGEGTRVVGTVAALAGPSDVDIMVASIEHEAPPAVRITVVQALLKGDALERAVEMLTEIGVDAIVPWAAQHSVAVWRGERVRKGTGRLQAAASAAGKQSRRARFPSVGGLVDSTGVAGLCRGAAMALVLHEAASQPIAGIEPPRSGSLVLIVGPEGGIAVSELAMFAEAGAACVRMGPTVLRAATAGTAAGSVIMARSGRWA